MKPRNHLVGPRKTTAREDIWICNESKTDRYATATAISKRANDNLGIKISKHTISQRHNEINLNSRVASTKPYISKNKQMNRLKFLTEHVIWTVEQWDCDPFSHESMFNLFACDGRRLVRHSPKSSVKFGGGSEMVFGMISVSGTGSLVRLHGKINATVYKEILKKHVPNLRTAINQPAVFTQDNARCHTVKPVKTFLSEEDITVMEWPAQSPDMTPIESVCKLQNERPKEKTSKKRQRTMD